MNFAAAWKESEVAKAVMEAAKKAATAKVKKINTQVVILNTSP